MSKDNNAIQKSIDLSVEHNVNSPKYLDEKHSVSEVIKDSAESFLHNIVDAGEGVLIAAFRAIIGQKYLNPQVAAVSTVLNTVLEIVKSHDEVKKAHEVLQSTHQEVLTTHTENLKEIQKTMLKSSGDYWNLMQQHSQLQLHALGNALDKVESSEDSKH